jgi:hypothetical protein
MDIKTPREYFLDNATERHWNVLYGSKICLDFCKEYAEYYHKAKLKLLGIANVVGQSEQLECDCTQPPFRYNELGTCKYCGKQKKEAL